jgi:ankyrin repeat protein
MDQADDLHNAALTGNITRVIELLETGVNVNARTTERSDFVYEDGTPELKGFTALIRAASAGHIEIVRLIMDQGAEIDATTYNGWTALKIAVANGHREIARLLLTSGASVATPEESDSTTTLTHAVLNNDREMVIILLNAGADVNKIGYVHLGFRSRYLPYLPPLTVALMQGHLELANVLIKRGAHVKLIHAVMLGDYGRVQALLRAGDDVNAAKPGELELLDSAIRGGHLEIVLLLLDSGLIIPDKQGSSGSALWLAAVAGETEMVEILLSRTKHGNLNSYSSALYATAYAGHLNIVRLLLDHGAEVNTVREGRTVLINAVEGGHADVVSLLLDWGADVNAKDRKRNTALSHIGDHTDRKQQIITLLTQAGAQ